MSDTSQLAPVPTDAGERRESFVALATDSGAATDVDHFSVGFFLDEEFAADITITAQFITDQFPAFQDALRELSHGRLEAEIVETDQETIMPMGTLVDESEKDA